MSLTASCVLCSAPVVEADGAWSCPEHGATGLLWRPPEVSYDGFVEHLRIAGAFPTYLPWPMSPGWSVTDFATVAAEEGRGTASLTCTSGTSELDGPVDVLVVAEEAGTGLGARCAGTRYTDPGHEIGYRSPSARVRIGSQAVNLWDISTSGSDGEFDRSVLAGEAAGRWLWIVLRPASALLLFRDDWILRDVSNAGPQLVELPFGGHRPGW
ncbi:MULTISPECIES: DUF6758 family protein [unclassified Nocardioides]|uniref:DUF6758 family protein n=1 Tax=unclassified Nocardioides TaxID=2615069 RepID=UPI0036223C3C